MTEPAGYQLLDAGDGRRLERFGDRVVDRPAPQADDRRRDPDAWKTADLRFERRTGWSGGDAAWLVRLGDLTVELRPTETGQVGLFPEHAFAWPWYRRMLRSRSGAEVLQLFAATGATTLALAAAGARVTHVDSARPAVAWARRNAELSGLAERPVRWIVDEAAAFVAREQRRRRRYAGIVLDPPSYGHGAGRAWRLERDLPDLVAACGELLEPEGWLLLTTHATGWDERRLRASLPDALATRARWDAGPLELRAASGATLRLGAWLRGIILA